MKNIIVQSESADYYVIPADMKEEWESHYCFEDDLPEWCHYVSSLSSVTFDDWTHI
jgi:hypothetical protein